MAHPYTQPITVLFSQIFELHVQVQFYMLLGLFVLNCSVLMISMYSNLFFKKRLVHRELKKRALRALPFSAAMEYH